MDIKFRRIIYKSPFIHNVCQKIVDINNARFYKKYSSLHNQDELFRNMKGSHEGERCFIVGNGPSLTICDLELIKNEQSFAANLIFRIFDKTSWRPNNYFLIDRYADTQDVLDTLNVQRLFIGDYYWRKRGVKNPNAICMRVIRNIDINNAHFSDDLAKGVYDLHTVTYVMIQVAIYLGFTEIYLIGMDHNYTLTYDSTGKVTEDPSVVSHFFIDKNPAEVIANVEAMNKAYLAAGEYANSHGIKIINSTRGGKLERFQRMPLEEVLNNGK